MSIRGEDVPDLVVAGAGGGLVAAVRAARLGRKVLLVEASEHFPRANNTAMSTAMVPGAGTRWQAEAGIDDSPECFAADLARKTKGEADPALARALATISARLVTWLADDAGLAISLVTDFPYPGHSRLRCHTVPGRTGKTLLAGLLAAARAEPEITVISPARLTGIGADGGAVDHVVLTYPDGRTEAVGTPAVLLATNGFGANPALVRQYLPEIADALYHGSPQSTGDALRIGMGLGADTGFLDAYQGHAALALPAGTLAGWATVMHGGFLVNDLGERFGDETVGYSEYARSVLRQPGGRAVIMIDQRVHDACLAFDDFRDTAASGALVWAADVPGLACRLGLDPARLAATFEEAASAARGELADRHGRTHWGSRSGLLTPLSGSLPRCSTPRAGCGSTGTRGSCGPTAPLSRACTHRAAPP